MKTYNHILSDLDGTLTDPQKGIVNSVQYALKRLGIKKKIMNCSILLVLQYT